MTLMVWIQYAIIDGSQTGTNSQRVSDADLAALGKAQIEYNGDPTNMMVDVTQASPAVIQIPTG